MAELKTKPNDSNVEEFLNGISDSRKQRDSFAILELMKQITGEAPKMWGNAIVGFGNSHYKYESGREGDWFIVGFSPRKQNISLYLSYGFAQNKELMDKLGKYKTGKACLYINKLEDIDVGILKELILSSIRK